MPSVDGGTLLGSFDGATMQSYLNPGKADEIVFCRQHPNSRPCSEGHGFDPERANLPISSLEVKSKTPFGEQVGIGVFAALDIPRQSYVGLEKLISSIRVPSHSYELVAQGYKHDHWRGTAPERYIHEYGHASRIVVS
jgi:hypothetical protein